LQNLRKQHPAYAIARARVLPTSTPNSKSFTHSKPEPSKIAKDKRPPLPKSLHAPALPTLLVSPAPRVPPPPSNAVSSPGPFLAVYSPATSASVAKTVCRAACPEVNIATSLTTYTAGPEVSVPRLFASTATVAATSDQRTHATSTRFSRHLVTVTVICHATTAVTVATVSGQ
jgi:hypothetical protein